MQIRMQSMLCGHLAPQHGTSLVCGLNHKQSRTADKGWSSSFGVGWGAYNSH